MVHLFMFFFSNKILVNHGEQERKHYFCEDGIENLLLAMTVCHLLMPSGDNKMDFSCTRDKDIFTLG